MQPLKLVLPVACGIAMAAFFITLGPSTAPVQARDRAARAVANWVTNGNSVGNKDFIGTINNKALVFKTNNLERVRILSNGNVGVGTKNASSMLTVAGVVESTNGGFKFPDGTTQTTATTGGANGWGLGGNAGTSAATNFIGTTDNQNFVLRTNNAERMRIDTSGKVGIGTNAPTEKLTLQTATANYGLVHTDGAITVGSWIGTAGGSPAGGWYGTKSNHPLHLFTNNGSASLTVRTNGNVGIGTTTPTSKLEIAAQDGLAITGFQPFLTLRDTNAGNAKSVIQSASGDMFLYPNSFIGGNPAMVIKNLTGNVGIGTSAPSAQLSCCQVRRTATQRSRRIHRVESGSTRGHNPASLKQNTAENTTPTLAYFETSNGDLGYLGAYTGAFILGGAANKGLGLNVNGSTRAMSIASNGVIGIGTNIINAKLHVKGIPNLDVLHVEDSSGIVGLRVTHVGHVQVHLLEGNASHVCHSSGFLSHCLSAAEYVPAINAGVGYPETGDLVSIAPNVKNPYGDEHGPFVVQKAATACDPNLLGFITNPEKGADGVKLNDHYLPLAIYGYFPAKVTTTNGIIKRGDALTSSSKAGYAMKATGACKIIGYALEDATSDGQIQIFADLGENSAPQVARLQTQVDVLAKENLSLKQENQSLKEMLAAMDARLKALEVTSPVSYKPTR